MIRQKRSRGADVVVTDTWVSMGQAHADTKLKALMPYQVTPMLMACAKPDAVFLHCLPAHRGEEVMADVIDGPQSLIWGGSREPAARAEIDPALVLWPDRLTARAGTPSSGLRL